MSSPSAERPVVGLAFVGCQQSNKRSGNARTPKPKRSRQDLSLGRRLGSCEADVAFPKTREVEPTKVVVIGTKTRKASPPETPIPPETD